MSLCGYEPSSHECHERSMILGIDELGVCLRRVVVLVVRENCDVGAGQFLWQYSASVNRPVWWGLRQSTRTPHRPSWSRTGRRRP